MAQVRSGLKDRDSLVRFLERELGYKTTLVSYEATELDIPPYLAGEVTGWWLVSDYSGKPPFQIHFAEIKELTLYPCRSIVNFFLNRHPGYYLFIFTQNYCYVLFLTIELSLERRPNTLQLLPKYYHRFFLLDCANPTGNDAYVLTKLQAEPTQNNPVMLYNKVLDALKLPGHDLPEWFMSWYYRLGYSQDTWEKLRKSGTI